jgi:hypothetical protein
MDESVIKSLAVEIVTHFSLATGSFPILLETLLNYLWLLEPAAAAVNIEVTY